MPRAKRMDEDLTSPSETARFVISLDFELLWGVRDHADKDSYGRNVLGAREAIPRILDLFEKNGIRATWATVGFLFCESKEELISVMPERGLRPSYSDPRTSNYGYLEDVGEDERSDPYYFAPSLITFIKETPGQEIGSHTFSHYYCLEDGQTLEQFDADLSAARTIAERRGIDLRSIVFPRNQYSEPHLEICRRRGFKAFRGNQKSWAYRPTNGIEQTLLRRAVRLVDAHTGVLGAHASHPSSGAPRNCRASQFLRPRSGRLARFHPLHVSTIARGMRAAARRGTTYHLWWHPHNFGADLEANLAGLNHIINHFVRLREHLGMVSEPMAHEALANNV